jgi:hypothetical protein
MPAKMPWKTQVMGPSFGKPPPQISARDSNNPYDWASIAQAYTPGSLAMKQFSSMGGGATPVTLVTIDGQYMSAALDAGATGLCVICADTPGGMLHVADTAGNPWPDVQLAGSDLIAIAVSRCILTAPLGLTDLVHVTADSAVIMNAAVMQIGYPESDWLGVSGVQTGNGIAAKAAKPGKGNEDCVVIYGAGPSNDANGYPPLSPTGYTTIIGFSGNNGLWATVAIGNEP